MYNYQNSIYRGNKIKLNIECPLHGDFQQTPNSHLSGSGCPQCATELYGGYSRSDFVKKTKGKNCIFYILKLFNENEEFYKIGIASTSIIVRYSTKAKMPYSYEIIQEIKGEAGEIWDLELKNKRLLKDFHYTPKINFKGSVTECFSDVNLLLNTTDKT